MSTNQITRNCIGYRINSCNFYLNHRYSEDLDFFINGDPRYVEYIDTINKGIRKEFSINNQLSLFAEDFTRLVIGENEHTLKVEFVNDVNYYPGQPLTYRYGLIDSPLNILANKITAVISRDEPKDVYDIIHLAMSYSFIWEDIFYHAKEKSVINEIDVSQRLHTFPIDYFETVKWLRVDNPISEYKNLLKIIADDFLFGQQNSIGISKIGIEKAQPLL